MIFCNRTSQAVLGLLALLLSTGALAASPIASVSASRVSGKAPLMVFFDGTASTDPDLSKPIHHLTYCFNAGDGNTDTYSKAGHKTTNKSNFCGSPLFAYVYETPGTYTMTLTVTDEDGNSDVATINVTVNDYTDSETECISSSGTFTGDIRCAKAIHTTSSDFDQAVSSCLANGRRRCLLRGGETFAVSTRVNVSIDGVHIGAFGTGPFTISGQNMSAVFFAGGDDVRLTDGNYSGDGGQVFLEVNKFGSGDTDNLLVQNWTVNDLFRVLEAGANAQSGSDLPSWIGFFSNEFTNCNSGNTQCFFIAVEGFAIVDSILAGTVGIGTHVVRLQHAEKDFIHNNKFSGAKTNQHLLTVRALDINGKIGGISNRWAQHAFISDNWFIGDSIIPVQMVSGNDPSHTANHRDHIFERNLITFSATGCNLGIDECQMGIQITSGGGPYDNATFRNNIADLTNSATFSQMFKGSAGFGKEFYNNSVFSDNQSDRNFYSSVGNCIAKNNVMWVAGGPPIVMFNGGNCSSQSNNYDTNGGETGVTAFIECPYFSCPPKLASDFAPRTSSAAELIDAGTAVPYRCDFNQEDAPDNLREAGAYEFGNSSITCVAAARSQQPGLNARVIGVTP